MEIKIVVKTGDEQEEQEQIAMLQDLFTITCEEVYYAKNRI